MNKILQETIEMYNDYIKKVAIGSVEIPEYLRQNRVEDAYHLITGFSQGMQWIQEVNSLFKLNNIKGILDLDIIKADLEEINNALIVQDNVLLADIFEYEIEPFFSSFLPIEVN